MINALVLSHPVGLFFSNNIPVYLFGYILLKYSSKVSQLLKTPYVIVILKVIDGFNSGYILPIQLNRIRNTKFGLLYGRDLLPTQLILGTLANCGGGILFVNVLCKQPLKFLNFRQLTCLAAAYIVINIFDYNEGMLSNLSIFSLLSSSGKEIPTEEIQFFGSVILATVFIFDWIKAQKVEQETVEAEMRKSDSTARSPRKHQKAEALRSPGHSVKRRSTRLLNIDH